MRHLPFEQHYLGKRVLITGDTGFTGSWMVQWLRSLGATIVGIALPPPSEDSLFAAVGAAGLIEHHDADIRDALAMKRLIAAARPDFVFHLAAQALVRQSYRDPLETYSTNVMGTANVLDACREVPGIRGIVVITTDKVYYNNEWSWGYRETDALGGKDPYSASKAACELVVSSYRSSFLSNSSQPIPIAVARAGNIVGGGDWAEDRIVVDMVRAIVGGSALKLRNPSATRPWQHVLSACHGYLLLGAGLVEKSDAIEGAWNFGPEASETRSVAEVVKVFAEGWQRPEIHCEPSALAEAGALMIDSQRARQLLGWKPAWQFEEVFRRTAQWYRGFYDGRRAAAELCSDDIEAYRAVLAARLG